MSKTYKMIISTLFIMIFIGGSALPTFAESITIEELSKEYELFEMEEDFMKEFEDLGDCVNVSVKIYSEDNRLVRCSAEKNDMINELIRRADFLADVGGIEIYRLNK